MSKQYRSSQVSILRSESRAGRIRRAIKDIHIGVFTRLRRWRQRLRATGELYSILECLKEWGWTVEKKELH